MNPYYDHFRGKLAMRAQNSSAGGNPYYAHFRITQGKGLPNDSEEFGHIYRRILHQRGYGRHLQYGLGWGDAFGKIFNSIKPLLIKGLQYLGQTAVSTGANIASDVISGEDLSDAAKNRLTEAKEDLYAKAPGAVQSLVNSGLQASNKGPSTRRKTLSRQSVGHLATSARISHTHNRKRKKQGRGLHKSFPILSKF